MNLRQMLQTQVGENVEVYFMNEVLEGKILATRPSVFEIEISGGTYTSPFTRANIPYDALSYVRVLV
ncbi:hypothetical protein [Baia soyae]|uniref:Uncharacterized protein n=1 Tax=Baia soyae TaxID=1544746 RepID=A0A4R2RQA9_9BACL|nr:hypothetical protein [Baia soyae]TCP64587.1 hypothetical protein EDD57_13917 [Baia soyae]